MAEAPIVPPITPPPPPETTPERPLHTLPPPFTHATLTPITQGAEALVYKTTFLTPSTPVVVKYRPPKPYRHPTLDRRLTKQRLLAEARSLIHNLMRLVGTEVGKLHNLGVCHGDLTTSNIMLRTPPSLPSSDADSLDGTVYLIDFGLTSASIQDEDKAVDLYVLERAFAATHPAAEPLFQEVLAAYGEMGKGAKSVLRRLEDVRLRGRKRSMLG
ncbi:Serine/threonine-protein kinase bud32 [Pyrenophora tritici-repentis]|nr:Serine/threonine-protein kinase bud32 [Pyrenophora tritici-repentis]KAI0619885.1 Serine/threonine-protein kinase bud32 [Pyrenophora tritici-repentis]